MKKVFERDMVLRPDISTASAAHGQGWTLQIIHDAFDRKEEPIPFAPRNVLKRVIDLYHANGWDPIVAPKWNSFLLLEI